MVCSRKPFVWYGIWYVSRLVIWHARGKAAMFCLRVCLSLYCFVDNVQVSHTPNHLLHRIPLYYIINTFLKLAFNFSSACIAFFYFLHHFLTVFVLSIPVGLRGRYRGRAEKQQQTHWHYLRGHLVQHQLGLPVLIRPTPIYHFCFVLLYIYLSDYYMKSLGRFYHFILCLIYSKCK